MMLLIPEIYLLKDSGVHERGDPVCPGGLCEPAQNVPTHHQHHVVTPSTHTHLLDKENPSFLPFLSYISLKYVKGSESHFNV